MNISVDIINNNLVILLLAMKAFAQDIRDQEEAGEEDEAKQAYPSLDSHAH